MDLIRENQYLCCVYTGNISDASIYTSGLIDNGFTLDKFFGKILQLRWKKLLKKILSMRLRSI